MDLHGKVALALLDATLGRDMSAAISAARLR